MQVTNHTECSIPHNPTGRLDRHVPDPELDPALTDHQQDDRVLARNVSSVVVVPLPRFAWPTTEDAVPLFVDISTTAYDQTPTDIRDCLAAAEDHFDTPAGAAGCFYSVRCESIQLSSNTLGRFLDDLERIESLATEIEGVTPTDLLLEVFPGPQAACLWPTGTGWFYLQATGRKGDQEYTVQYGILRAGIPLENAPHHSFFADTPGPAPHTGRCWPNRRLTLSGNRRQLLARRRPVGDRLVAPDDETRLLADCVAGNPLYGVDLDRPNSLSSYERQELYHPIQSVSTLWFEQGHSNT